MTSKKVMGIVSLVGAGPGDPGLITLRGKERIEQADVILHDALVHPDVLTWASPHAEKISVGKRAGKESTWQEDIQSLMKNYAEQGKRVVRLKGGDPMIFGRGAEELNYLAAHNIPFEIVPGISSAIAAPTYAGIPLTHRALASSVAFITGMRKDPKEFPQFPPHGSIDTLVILMALNNLPIVLAQLKDNGWPLSTPIAFIDQGTLPTQKVIVGEVTNIEARINESSPEGPALLVVGEVVREREKLAWFENRPLMGTSVLITRAKEQAGGMRSLLEERGASVVEFPTIEIVPVSDAADRASLTLAAQNIADFDLLIFTSVNGVKFFFDAVRDAHSTIPTFSHTQFAAIGPATADALRSIGLKVDFVPNAQYQQEGLLEILLTSGVQGKRILLPRARGARDFLAPSLREKGAIVTEVAVYEAKLPAIQNGNNIHRVKTEPVDFVTFTSSSTVHHFFSILGSDAATLLARSVAASIGAITSATLREYGVEPKITATESTVPGLIRAIEENRRTLT